MNRGSFILTYKTTYFIITPHICTNLYNDVLLAKVINDHHIAFDLGIANELSGQQ